MKKFGIRNLCTFTLSLLMICSLFLHSSSALTSSAQALTLPAQALTLPAQSQSKPMQTQGKKRAYSELKGLWISEEVLDPQYQPARRELIQFADDKQKSFAVGTLSGSVTGGDTTVKITLKGHRQTANDAFETVYKLNYRNESDKSDVWESEYQCSIRWIDDNTIEILNLPFSFFSDRTDEEGNELKPVPRRYTRIAKSRIPIFSSALQSMNAQFVPEGWAWAAAYEENEVRRVKYLDYLESKDKKILDAIEKDYKEIYKSKGKYKNIRFEVMMALEAIAG